MNRIINFSAGPAKLPFEVLKEVKRDLLDYKGKGLSVMEMSHRSNDYIEILETAKESLKKLMYITDDYEILFLQGGASLQFSMIPMNLKGDKNVAFYGVTGNFANKAFEEGKKYLNAIDITNSKNDNYSYIPKIDNSIIDMNIEKFGIPAYLHITANNTIFGTSYNVIPKVKIPIVCDMSSIILGKEYNVNDFDLIYAGAQKNLGIAGLTVVILKKKLLDNNVETFVPTMLKYKIHSENNSMYNTPPTFSIYIAMLMFKWVIKMGGVSAMNEINKQKAKILYDVIDNSKIYIGTVNNKEDRSIMNVTFKLKNEELNDKFIKDAKEHGLVNLKGHRINGGMRSSIYNAISLSEVKKLAKFMKNFEREVK